MKIAYCLRDGNPVDSGLRDLPASERQCACSNCTEYLLRQDIPDEELWGFWNPPEAI